MPWIDNQYTFPRAAAANLQEIWPWPTPAETPPLTAPPINPPLRVKPLIEQPDDGLGDQDWTGFNYTDPNVPNYTGPGPLGLLSGGGTTYSGETTTPTFFEGVGDVARGIGKGAGVAGLLGGGPIAWGVEGLAGLFEMGSLNEVLATYAKKAGIKNVPQIGFWDAIAAGFNPFKDLRDVAQDYFFDPNELGDVWSDAGFDITEATPSLPWAEGFPPGPGFYDPSFGFQKPGEPYALSFIEDFDEPDRSIDWSPAMTSFLADELSGDGAASTADVGGDSLEGSYGSYGWT